MINLSQEELDKIQRSLIKFFKEDELETVLEVLKGSHRESYVEGFCDGLHEYAYWKDGTQYVDTCGTTLKEATERVVANGGSDTGQNPFFSKSTDRKSGSDDLPSG